MNHLQSKLVYVGLDEDLEKSRHMTENIVIMIFTISPSSIW